MKQRKRHLGAKGIPEVECVDNIRGTWVFHWDFRDEEEGNDEAHAILRQNLLRPDIDVQFHG